MAAWKFTAVLVTLLAAGLFAAPPPALVHFAPSPHAPAGVAPNSTGLLNLTIRDGQTISAVSGLLSSTLNDYIGTTQAPPIGYLRSYTISLTASLRLPLLNVNLVTNPLAGWAQPTQQPNGPDNLPPLSEWNWTVTTYKGGNDTANWTFNAATGTLSRVTPWRTEGFVVSGRTDPTVNVTVSPGIQDGSSATGGGYVVNAAGFTNSLPPVAGYTAMAQSLHPAILRIGVTSVFVGWNRTGARPVLQYSSFDTLFNFANATGAKVLVSLPAGNWGDGNTAPPGTPIVNSTVIGLHGMYGYFLTEAAEYSLVRGLLNHTLAAGETVAYWAVGNEVPLNSSAQTLLFAKVVDGATRAVKATKATGLVGTDAGLYVAWLPVIASHTTGLGFLAFHYYPAPGMCITPGGQYCPPSGAPNGTTTPTLFSSTSYGRSPKVYGPSQAQQAWYNATGTWVQMINDETNLNANGGGAVTTRNGSDPRMNDLVGAAWLGSLLVDSSEQNVSSLAYYSLSSAANLSWTTSYGRGGFGFGLTNASTAIGRITYFAPYFVMRLWDQYIPAGSSGLQVTSSDPTSVEAYAVDVGGQLHLAVVDRVGVPILVHVVVPGSFAAGPLLKIDPTTYAESYNSTSGQTSVTMAGVSSASGSSSGTFVMAGYGFTILEYYPTGV